MITLLLLIMTTIIISNIITFFIKEFIISFSKKFEKKPKSKYTEIRILNDISAMEVLPYTDKLFSDIINGKYIKIHDNYYIPPTKIKSIELK